MAYPRRVAAIDVSHWHARFDAAFLPILRDLDVEIVGVSDRDQAVAQSHADEFGGKAYSDYRVMVEEAKPEFVVALGRHVDMPDTFRFLIAEGIPFVMEKPWGIDAETVNGLADLAEATGGFAAVPFAMRYSAWATTAREMIEDGKFGAVSHIVFRALRPRQRRYRGWHSAWMYEKATAGGGCLWNLGPHGMDLSRFLTGEEPEVVSAVLSNTMDGLELEDYALVTLRTPSGILFHNEVGYVMPAWPQLKTWPKNYADSEQRVVGDKAILRMIPDGLQILGPDRDEVIPTPSGIEVGYPRAVRECLEAVGDGRPPPIGPRECARAVQLVADAYTLAGRA